jgi:hypothetical protein
LIWLNGVLGYYYEDEFYPATQEDIQAYNRGPVSYPAADAGYED